MAEQVGRFEKVSFAQYLQAQISCGRYDPEADNAANQKIAAYEEWSDLKLPVRATSGSAGYDFHLPANYSLTSAGEPIVIPTGIRAEIAPGWFLMMLPRSGLGFKYGIRLSNTAGIIDSDYFYADNEGHIMLKIATSRNVCLERGDRFAQGIFMPHGVTVDDKPLKEARRGGFGSTGRQSE